MVPSKLVIIAVPMILLQYRIFLDSFFYWLGICKPQVKDRVYSVTELTIQREPLLNADFEANFDDEVKLSSLHVAIHISKP